jgi:pilus assembly protein CpaB
MAETTIPAPSPVLGGRKVLIAALILGAITAGLIVAYLASQEDATTSETPIAATTIEVVVAKQDIAVGTEIDATMIEVKEMPVEVAISGAIEDISLVRGQTARYPVVRGQQFSIQQLVEPPKVKSLSFAIPTGMRGFTVPVDVTKSPAALLTPGDFVDVIVSAEIVQLLGSGAVVQANIEGADEDEPKAAITLLENVQVLAVQRDFVKDGVAYDSSTRGEPTEEERVNYVTLAVSPEDAQLLWLAVQEGELTLALRAFGDDALSELDPVTEPIRLP